MAYNFEKILDIEIQVKAGNPALLEGLDQWLQLGLIDEQQMLRLARNYLTCRLPVAPVAVVIPKPPDVILPPKEVILPAIVPVYQPPPPRPSQASLILQSFKDELSVRWLLFLGVFLVIVSSGVLAATNWQRFPTFLQYLVLWDYTVIFWGVGFWANKKDNLKLTSQTLQIIGFLLIPINFWAMDSFGLWQNPWQWLTVIIASISLSWICWWQQQESIQSQASAILRQALKIDVIAFLGLCFLHWGWNIPYFPIINLYLGMIGTTVIIRLLPTPKINHKNYLFTENKQKYSKVRVSKAFILFALVILLIRAIFIVHIPISQLGLAIGICGWLTTDLGRVFFNVNWRFPDLSVRFWSFLLDKDSLAALIWLNKSKQAERLSSNNQIFQAVGVSLMFLGWLVTVSDPLPWQAILISGLAIQFFSQRLLVYNWKGDILAIFFIGLQAVWLVSKLVPAQISQGVLDFGVAVTNVSIFPKSIYAVGFFPYLLIWVWLTGWLYRQHKPELADLGEKLTLGLGLMLTLIGLVNPTWRSLNLLFSTATLGYVTHRRFPIRMVLVWITHIYGILTIFSVINWAFPTFTELPFINFVIWATICLTLMVIEWLLSHQMPGDFAGKKLWQESNWFFGCFFAGSSYLLLLNGLDYRFNPIFQTWNCVWLVTPLTLTWLASRSEETKRTELAQFSIVTLILTHPLTWEPAEARLISVAVASGLMLLNTSYSLLPIRKVWVWLTHFYILVTLFLVIDIAFPVLRQNTSIYLLIKANIYLLVMVIEWLLSKEMPGNFADKETWQRSNWYFGFFFAFMSYLFLLYLTQDGHLTIFNQIWACGWLITPIALSYVASRSNSQERVVAANLSCISLIIAQTLTFNQLEPRLIGLAVATGLMFINTRYSRYPITAGLHIGFGLTLITVLLWEHITDLSWFVVGAIAILSLWALYHLGQRKSSTILSIYGQAADVWGLLLAIIELTALSINYLLFTVIDASATNSESLITCSLLSIAFIYRYRVTNPNVAVYGVGLLVEIALSEILVMLDYSNLVIAIANILLALAIIITIQLPQSQQYSVFKLSSWTNLALAYTFVAIIGRIPYFTPYTGLIILGAALTEIAIIKPTKQGNIISYLALGAISFGIYDLVIYQMLQAPAGNPADGITILAMVTAILALIYRSLVWYYSSQNKQFCYKIPISNLLITAHIHWALASLLKLCAASISINSQPQLPIIAISVSVCLGLYAVIQARSQEPSEDYSASDWWVYVGLVELTATGIYARLIWTNLSILDPLRVILACCVGLLIIQIPWRNLGWRVTPWHRAAIAIPALTIFATPGDISYLSLIAVALFYFRIAYSQRNIRWSYLSIGFLDYAIARYLLEHNITEVFFYISMIGLSILYIAQFDPSLQAPSERQNRHNWRLFGSSLICFTALISYQDYSGIVPASIGLIAVFLGLGLQIRAFLFIGTITFLATVFYQLVVLFFTYAFLKWIIGLILGILLITIAANFERSREQLILLMQNWLDKLEQWE